MSSVFIQRSTKIKLNYSNLGKRHNLFQLLTDETKRAMSEMINELIYNEQKIPVYLPKEYTDRLPFSGYVNQILAKEISSSARSIKNKLKNIKPGNNLQKYQRELLDKFNDKILKVVWNGNLQIDSRVMSIEENIEGCIMAKKEVVKTFRVRGKGELPTNPISALKITDACPDAESPENMKTRTVELHMYDPNGFGPTKERWSSFGWFVVNPDFDE